MRSVRFALSLFILVLLLLAMGWPWWAALLAPLAIPVVMIAVLSVARPANPGLHDASLEGADVPADVRRHLEAAAAELAALGFGPPGLVRADPADWSMLLPHRGEPHLAAVTVFSRRGKVVLDVALSTHFADGVTVLTSTSEQAGALLPPRVRHVRLPSVALATILYSVHLDRLAGMQGAVRPEIASPAAWFAQRSALNLEEMQALGWFRLDPRAQVARVTWRGRLRLLRDLFVGEMDWLVERRLLRADMARPAA